MDQDQFAMGVGRVVLGDRQVIDDDSATACLLIVDIAMDVQIETWGREGVAVICQTEN